MTGIFIGGRKGHSKDRQTDTLTHTGDYRGRLQRCGREPVDTNLDGYHQTLGRGEEGFYRESQREHSGAADTLISQL